MSNLDLSSPAFSPGATIPVSHTCDGADRSPALSWSTPPQGTRSLVLIVDDPDAPGGTFVHWLLYSIPPSTTDLKEGMPTTPALTEPAGAKQGRNGFGRIGYGGPCPPPGKPHRYFFRLYALDNENSLAAGASRAHLDEATAGHVLATGELMGVYGR
ncbi:MAG: YbhB/YbcL family Raf kinase inhibitor-like protein [Actinomycetota bacterium]